MRTIWMILAAVVAVAAMTACGGSDSTSLSPPTYNVTGTWNMTMTIGYNTAGVASGTQETGVLIMNQAAGSNTVYIRDQNSAVGDAQPATLSGATMTYSGSFMGMYGCPDMVASLNATFSSATSVSGSGRLTCNTSGDYGDVTFTGTRQ